MASEFIIELLEEYKSIGLRIEHFDIFAHKKITFSFEHALALGTLFGHDAHKSLSLKKIVDTVATFNKDQLDFLIFNHANGVDLIKFSEFCKKYGEFTKTECDFLCILLNIEKYSVPEAFARLKQISDEEKKTTAKKWGDISKPNSTGKNYASFFYKKISDVAQASKNFINSSGASTPRLGEGPAPGKFKANL